MKTLAFPPVEALSIFAALLPLLVTQDISKNEQPSARHNVTLPARAAFYYPWYPETWQVNGAEVFYRPDLGHYRSGSREVVDAHIRALGYANIDVGIASWWGAGTHDEATRLPLLLNRTRSLGSPLKWSVYYEKEGSSDPSVAALRRDLRDLQAYAKDAAYAHVAGKPVLFVYNADDKSCALTERWAEATRGEWYVSLKVFSGYRDCPVQPDAWHQYAPANAHDHQLGYAYTVSPGFWRADGERPRLKRDLARWRKNVRDMVASGEPWQLVTTFNEWGEGTAVEAAGAWGEAYLDVLADDNLLELRDPHTDEVGEFVPQGHDYLRARIRSVAPRAPPTDMWRGSF